MTLTLVAKQKAIYDASHHASRRRSPRMMRESESLREIVEITQVQMTAEEIRILKLTVEGVPSLRSFTASCFLVIVCLNRRVQRR